MHFNDGMFARNVSSKKCAFDDEIISRSFSRHMRERGKGNFCPNGKFGKFVKNQKCPSITEKAHSVPRNMLSLGWNYFEDFFKIPETTGKGKCSLFPRKMYKWYVNFQKFVKTSNIYTSVPEFSTLMLLRDVCSFIKLFLRSSQEGGGEKMWIFLPYPFVNKWIEISKNRKKSKFYVNHRILGFDASSRCAFDQKIIFTIWSWQGGEEIYHNPQKNA